MPTPLDLTDLLARIDAPWTPAIVAELNGQHIKLAKFQGDFVWHAHESADEAFLVLQGTMLMRLRDGDVPVTAGQLMVIPAGVEHCPSAPDGAHVLLFEPAGTVNTGSAGGLLTVEPKRL